MASREKKEQAHDFEAMKEYVNRFFTIQQEIKGLRDDVKDLKDEYKKRVDMKLVANVIKLVKAEIALNSCEQSIDETKDIILDKIGMLVD